MDEQTIQAVRAIIAELATKPLTQKTILAVTSGAVLKHPKLPVGKSLGPPEISQVKTNYAKEVQKASDPWERVKGAKQFYPLGSFAPWSWEYWLNYFYQETPETERRTVYDALIKPDNTFKRGPEIPSSEKKRLLALCLETGFDAFRVREKLSAEQMFETTSDTPTGAKGLRVLFRGDGRKPDMIKQHHGTLPQTRVRQVRASRGIDNPDARLWHPFWDDDRAYTVYFRKGQHAKDNCLFTAISVATDFETATKFPMLDDLIATSPAEVGYATVLTTNDKFKSTDPIPTKAQKNATTSPKFKAFDPSGVNTGRTADIAKHHQKLVGEAVTSQKSTFQPVGQISVGTVRDLHNVHTSRITDATPEKKKYPDTVKNKDKNKDEVADPDAVKTERRLRASRTNIYVVRTVAGWNTEQKQRDLKDEAFPERAVSELSWFDHLAVIYVTRIHFDDQQSNKGHLIVIDRWEWLQPVEYVRKHLTAAANLADLEEILNGFLRRSKLDAKGVGGMACYPSGKNDIGFRIDRVLGFDWSSK